MTMFDVMLNLCIGIVGGIFSSIIVSRIFLINFTFTEQIARVQEHFEKSYVLGGLIGSYSIYVEREDLPDDTTVERINRDLLKEIHIICKNELDSFNAMIFDDLEDNLHSLAVELNDIICELSGLKVIDKETMISFGARLLSVQNKFNAYKKLSPKIFRKQLWKDKCLRILMVIFIIVIVGTIIA